MRHVTPTPGFLASAGWKAIAAMRRYDLSDFEDDLGAVAQAHAARVDNPAAAVDVHTHVSTEAKHPRGAQRPTPDLEEIRERCATLEGHDAGRIRRPYARATRRSRNAAEHDAWSSEADGRRDDHDPAVREELEMHARRTVKRCRDARTVGSGPRVEGRPNPDRRRHKRQHGKHKHSLHAIPLALAIVSLLTACGGGSKQGTITIQPAREFRLDEINVVHPNVGKPVVLSFRIIQPDGTPLTAYKHGAGPHTGVHLILVRRDLSVIIHRHPVIKPNGTFSEPVTFVKAGPYRLVIDAYPAHTAQANFQLFSTLEVAGAYSPEALPPLRQSQTVDGNTFTLHGTPHLRAIVPAFLNFTVTGPNGKPALFTPWYGALAHAIFFRKGSLDYFHTHICAPGATACSSAIGGSKVTGTSASPGKLTVGVLVPLAGTWRLFLQCRIDGRVITAPFTLTVR